MTERILNITNGDCAVAIMRAAKVPGEFLPWRDGLHEGPVPSGLSLQALSTVRSQYIAGLKWGEYPRIRQAFSERDSCLHSFADYEEVVLWFEHDLYDQLQLIQILDWFFHHGRGVDNLNLICTENYLGRLNPEEMAGMVRYKNRVTQAQLQLANRVWSAFRNDRPEAWCALLDTDTTALPFLHGAILRQLQEYPDIHSGLSLTASYALDIIAENECGLAHVFGASQSRETRIFMGDASFWLILQSMLDSTPALLETSSGQTVCYPVSNQQTIRITDTGRAVLSGTVNYLDLIDIDRWIGGVHLDASNIWCWQPASSTILPFIQ